MVQKRAALSSPRHVHCLLSSSAGHCTWYRSGRCPVLLGILHGTEVCAFETCLAFYIVKNLALSSSVRLSIWYRIGRCRVLLDILRGTVVGAGELFSTCLWYYSGFFRLLLDILRCRKLGSVVFCSTFYMLWKSAVSISSRHCTWYRNWRCRFLLDILHGIQGVTGRTVQSSGGCSLC